MSDFLSLCRRFPSHVSDGPLDIVAKNAKPSQEEYEELLQSLNSEQTTYRYRTVEKAEERTFDWLFEKPELGFESWLKTGTGLYWIRGQPASGKSTLMKWLLQDSRTSEALMARKTDRQMTVPAMTAGKSLQINANFFFHNRGSDIQKSFAGLLHCVLFQIISTVRAMGDLLIPLRREIIGRRQISTWTQEDLEFALHLILAQDKVSTDLILFLDAIDEFDGTPEEMVKVLKLFTSADTAWTQIRICFSGRPLQIFLDEFDTAPGFYIQDHTDADIRRVIQTRLSQNPRFVQYQTRDNPNDLRLVGQFADTLASKAKGVFLWVVLALKELLLDFTEGEDLHVLITRLDSLPSQLEKYYEHTVNRIPSKYHVDLFNIFQVMLCSGFDDLRVHDVVHICQNVAKPTLKDFSICETNREEQYDDGAQRWVRSRTGGLIQLVNVDDGSVRGGAICRGCSRCAMPSYNVQFLHQTVKTFAQNVVRSPPASIGNVQTKRDGDWHIARYIMAVFAKHPLRDSYVDERSMRGDNDKEDDKRSLFWGRWGPIPDINNELLRAVMVAESCNPLCLITSLEQFSDDGFYDAFHHILWTEEWEQHLIWSRAAAAANLGLTETLDQLIQRDAATLNAESRSLLHFLIGGIFAKGRSPLKVPFEHHLADIRLLLDKGAGMYQRTNGETAFELFCRLRMDSPRLPTITDNVKLLQTARIFLEAGQNPDVQIRYRRRLGKRIHQSGEQCLLHWAAESHSASLVRELLRYNANVNALDSYGHTPLDFVCDRPWFDATGQISFHIENFLAEHDPMDHHLRDRLEIATQLVSKGGRYGAPFDATQKFGVHEGVVTEAQVRRLQTRGINVDDRIVWKPSNLLSSDEESSWTKHFSFLSARFKR